MNYYNVIAQIYLQKKIINVFIKNNRKSDIIYKIITFVALYYTIYIVSK